MCYVVWLGIPFPYMTACDSSDPRIALVMPIVFLLIYFEEVSRKSIKNLMIQIVVATKVKEVYTYC